MYKIYADDLLFYDDVTPEQAFKLINPKLKMSDSSAGSLTFILPINNVAYDKINRLTTLITVFCEGKEIWQGRVITESQNFWKQRSITCEGELAFFNDTIQPPSEFHGTIIGFLTQLLEQHNSQVINDKVDKLFYLGKVTVEDPNDFIYRYTNYETTLNCINEKLIDRLGGHIIVRKEDGKRYVDYLADYPNTNQQVIEFGINLLDFSKSFDLSDLATVIVPRGERLEESPIEALDAYLTVESVNGGSIYVENPEAVNAFGKIVSVVDWNDVTDPSNLLNNAKKYLEEEQFDKMVLEISAVDMHLLNVDAERIKLLDNIRCKSTPHGMDRYFPVSQVEIPLDSPEETVFTLNSSVKLDLSSTTSKSNSNLAERIAELPSKQSILNQALNNSKEMLNTTSHGQITFEQDENGRYYEEDILDTNSKSTATKAWMWNAGGLAYISGNGQRIFDDDGNILPTADVKAAITMDGSIVADRISTGTMLADRILGGTLTLGGYDNTYGQLFVKNGSGKTIGRWDKNGICLSDGIISSMDNESYGIMIDNGEILVGQGSDDYSQFPIEMDKLVGKIRPLSIWGEDKEFGFEMTSFTTSGEESGQITLWEYGIDIDYTKGNSYIGLRNRYVSMSTIGNYISVDYDGIYMASNSRLSVGDGNYSGNLLELTSNEFSVLNHLGCSGTLRYVSNIEATGDGGIQWWTNEVYFANGLMNTNL